MSNAFEDVLAFAALQRFVRAEGRFSPNYFGRVGPLDLGEAFDASQPTPPLVRGTGDTGDLPVDEDRMPVAILARHLPFRARAHRLNTIFQGVSL